MLFKRKSIEDMFDVKQKKRIIGIRLTDSEWKQMREIARSQKIPVTTATRIIVQNYLQNKGK